MMDIVSLFTMVARKLRVRFVAHAFHGPRTPEAVLSLLISPLVALSFPSLIFLLCSFLYFKKHFFFFYLYS